MIFIITFRGKPSKNVILQKSQFYYILVERPPNCNNHQFV